MANRIRELRQARGWSMEELASKVEGSPHFTTIAKIERAQRSLSQEWMGKISAALGVQPVDLISGGEQRPRMVPLLGNIAAGSWQEAIADSDEMVIAPAGGPNVFGLKPQGNSMNEVIMDGAYVLVDPDITDLCDGAIYAVRNDGNDTTLKMYRSDPPRLEPRSSDPSHQPIIFGREPFTVIGRVIWQGRQM